MKRKILSSILLLVVVFQLFSLVVFAEESANAASDAAKTDLLLEEMKTNMTDEATGKTKFDISKYPKSENGSPLVIGGYESGIFDELDSALYFYVYNPSEKEISQIKAGLRVKFILNGETVYINVLLDYPSIELVNASIGDCSNRFYKAKIDLSSYASKYDPKDCTEHVFTLDYTMFYYESESRPVKLDNEIDFTFGIDKTNEKLKCDVSNKEVDELEIGMTCYRHGSFDADLHTVNQINTAYFSVPDRYAEYFENIYSIASTYKKKTTVPIMWGDFPSNYRELVFLSEDMEETSSFNDNGIGAFYLYAQTGIANDLSVFDSGNIYLNHYAYGINKKYSFDDVVKFSMVGADGDDVLPNSVILKWFEEWQNDGSNKVLFVDSEYCNTTRTIDQTFDSLTYDTQVDFWKRVEDYGFWSALKNHYPSGKFSVDEDLYDIPYIVCCDDAVRKDLSNLSKADFCYKYFIHESDYENFKAYLKTHSNVYLYRFDISEHWSDVLSAGTVDCADFTLGLDNTFGICQTAYYDDFQVVNLTFKNDDFYLSAAVTSDPQDFIGPGEVVDGDPDKDEFGDWWAELMAKLEEFWATIKRFMTVIGIIVVVILVVTVVGHFTGILSNVSNIFKNNRKNE